MLSIKPVITSLQIVRHSQHDQLYVKADDGRCWSVVPDYIPHKYNYWDKSAIRTLNRLAEALRKNGQIVQVDETIPAKHEDAS
jgi:MFS superfamily sulfate permease-like transporter